MKARMAESGPPPLGLHILMGQDAGVKAGNMAAGIAKGAIAPVLVLARKKSQQRPRNASVSGE